MSDPVPIFASAPPERIELGDQTALVRWSVERVPATVEAINSSLEHLQPWMAWATEPATVAALSELFTTAADLWDRRQDFGYSLVSGPDDEVIGGCGLHGRLGPDGLEIGYWVHVDHCGRGLATATARALTDAAFGIDGIEQVRITCAEDNTRSARVPEKLGYTFQDLTVPDDGPCAGRSTQVWVVRRAEWMAGRTERGS